MTIPELPPLPLEWQERKSHSGRLISYRLFSGSCHVATVAKNDGYFEAVYRPYDKGLSEYGNMALCSKHRSLDKAKVAAEKAAQAEWKRFVTQLYAPHDPSH